MSPVTDKADFRIVPFICGLVVLVLIPTQLESLAHPATSSARPLGASTHAGLSLPSLQGGKERGAEGRFSARSHIPTGKGHRAVCSALMVCKGLLAGLVCISA